MFDGKKQTITDHIVSNQPDVLPLFRGKTGSQVDVRLVRIRECVGNITKLILSFEVTNMLHFY